MVKQSDFAIAVGISAPAVSNLVKRGILKGDTLSEWVISYCSHLRTVAAGRTSAMSEDGGALDLVNERALLTREQRIGERMKNLEKGKQLVRVNEMAERMDSAAIAARTMWLDTAVRLAREMPNDEDSRLAYLKKEFELFLHKLADWKYRDESDDDD